MKGPLGAGSSQEEGSVKGPLGAGSSQAEGKRQRLSVTPDAD